jgi:hypothetical protein
VCVCGDERSEVMAVGDSDRRKSINPQVEVEPPIQETYII